MRESGYYWVKIKTDEWRILYYSKEKSWWVTSFNLSLEEKDFIEIDEKQIIKQL
jgi:hypothetical protein